MKCGSGEGDGRAWKVYMVRCSALLLITELFVAVCFNGALEPVKNAAASQKLGLSKGNYAAVAEEIFNSTADDTGGESDSSRDGSVNRVGTGGTECSKDNILVFQGPTAPLPNGIPTYTVEIHNVCLSDACAISNIHLSCGWFSSARLVDPKVFRRVGYDDCLVNDGSPLDSGDTLSFQYANTFKYPLSVSSVSC